MSGMIHGWILDRHWEEREKIFVQHTQTENGPYGKLTLITRRKVLCVGAAQKGIRPSGGWTISGGGDLNFASANSVTAAGPIITIGEAGESPRTLTVDVFGGGTKSFPSFQKPDGGYTGWIAKEEIQGCADKILGIYTWQITFTATLKEAMMAVYNGDEGSDD
jgi:hypothetical protein